MRKAKTDGLKDLDTATLLGLRFACADQVEVLREQGWCEVAYGHQAATVGPIEDELHDRGVW